MALLPFSLLCSWSSQITSLSTIHTTGVLLKFQSYMPDSAQPAAEDVRHIAYGAVDYDLLLLRREFLPILQNPK